MKNSESCISKTYGNYKPRSDDFPRILVGAGLCNALYADIFAVRSENSLSNGG
ncbi:hypothetical protein [uncultured Cloacibacillus sp.]|uniref:hypothetical protein n=1 Tax=uncultured Cloacibacillus sp. TaxID=889794 RepID=UPI002585F8B5|nr:hypothetical protein [uncultured Cloacibacillus sp.]